VLSPWAWSSLPEHQVVQGSLPRSPLIGRQEDDCEGYYDKQEGDYYRKNAISQ